MGWGCARAPSLLSCRRSRVASPLPDRSQLLTSLPPSLSLPLVPGWPSTWVEIVLDKMIKSDIEPTYSGFRQLVRAAVER